MHTLEGCVVLFGSLNHTKQQLTAARKAFLPEDCRLHASRFTLFAGCPVWGLLQLGVQVARSTSSLRAALDAARQLHTAHCLAHVVSPVQVKQRLAAAIKAFLHFDSDGSPECQEQQAPQDGGQEALGSNFAEHNGAGPGEEDGM